MDSKKSTDRNIVHCLLCHKPQENLPVHLSRTCMKNSTPDDRVAEVQKAKTSNREWIRTNRTWDYNQLCKLLSDRRSRINMVKELLQRVFFIENLPSESELALDLEYDSADTSDSPSTQEIDTTTLPSCQLDPPTSSVYKKMKEGGLHYKLPADTKLLLDFKKFLTESQWNPNWKQEVDNVSRFLRYMQHTEGEPTLDFLSKSTKTKDFLTALQSTGMSVSTILNYFKSIFKLLKYLPTSADLQKSDPQLQIKCQQYQQLLTNLRKTVHKTHADKTSDTRVFVAGAYSITDCQKILRMAEPDVLKISENLRNGLTISGVDKTIYRYYCEALLVYRHMQRPVAVQSLTDTDWVERIRHGDRFVIGMRGDETSNMQIALTLPEEECLQMYFKYIRPDSIQKGKFYRSLFLSVSGETVHSVSQDINRFHEIYKLPILSSLDVRKAVKIAAKNLTEDQKEAIGIYLQSGTSNFKTLQPPEIVDTAVLLDSLAVSMGEESTSGQHDLQKEFPLFVVRFPVSLDGKPPCKRMRVDSGFPADHRFYHKWRASQYAQRVEYLLSHFTSRKPTVAAVAKLIAKEGWKANYPKPEDIVRLWKPAPNGSIETDTFLIECVSQQVWPGLSFKNFGAEKGLVIGVVATRPFSKGDIVCDYHGKVIPAADGRAMMEGSHDEARHMFFFNNGHNDLCIDAQTYPCECHPDVNPVGRRINHSSRRPNVKPFQCVLNVNGEDRIVILFKAIHDISIDTQLKFDYGVSRKAFHGEGQELEWLN